MDFDATCAAPEFVPYSGSSRTTYLVEGNELILSFSPGLENARTYRMSGPVRDSPASPI